MRTLNVREVVVGFDLGGLACLCLKDHGAKVVFVGVATLKSNEIIFFGFGIGLDLILNENITVVENAEGNITLFKIRNRVGKIPTRNVVKIAVVDLNALRGVIVEIFLAVSIRCGKGEVFGNGTGFGELAVFILCIQRGAVKDHIGKYGGCAQRRGGGNERAARGIVEGVTSFALARAGIFAEHKDRERAVERYGVSGVSVRGGGKKNFSREHRNDLDIDLTSRILLEYRKEAVVLFELVAIQKGKLGDGFGGVGVDVVIRIQNSIIRGDGFEFSVA